MWYHHLHGALLTLIVTIILLLIIGIGIFILLNKSKRFLFRDSDLKYFDVAFAGTVLIALSQLFAPLVATTYPVIFGQDASDYRLQFDNTYIIPFYNFSSNNSSSAETAADLAMDYDEVRVIVRNNTFYNNINVININQFIKYDKKIFLDIIVADEPAGIIVSLTRPVIEINQSSNLTIKFKDYPLPGLYRIRVRGTGEDGKIREAMMVIGIPETLGDDVIYFNPREDVKFVHFNFNDSVVGSGYFATYIYGKPNRTVASSKGTMDNLNIKDYQNGSGSIGSVTI
jgi:hypothetical protein